MRHISRQVGYQARCYDTPATTAVDTSTTAPAANVLHWPFGLNEAGPLVSLEKPTRQSAN